MFYHKFLTSKYLERVATGQEPKIPAYILVYEQVHIIKQCLENITKLSTYMDFVIIENQSNNSGKIKDMLDDLGSKGLLTRHIVFKKNITANAYRIVLENELNTIRDHRYVIVSDGDLTLSNPLNWLKEALSILELRGNIFCCGATMDQRNLPVHVFPNAQSWIPAAIKDHRSYTEGLTGCHLLAFKGRNLYDFLTWLKTKDERFVDGIMHSYAYSHSMIWARTKINYCYHLTWDLYAKVDSAYTKSKKAISFTDMWYKKKYADYETTYY